MTEDEFSDTPSSVRCRHCGERKGDHGCANNPHRAFACPPPDRKAVTPYSKEWWTVRTTAFEPCR